MTGMSTAARRDVASSGPGSEPVDLPQRLASDHRGRHGDVERTLAGRHRNEDASVGALMHMIGNAGAFPAKQENVVRPKAEARVGFGCLGGGEHEASASARPPGLETPQLRCRVSVTAAI